MIKNRIEKNSVEDLDMLNDTFGDTDSDAHMPWVVATGQTDSVLKSEVIHSGRTGRNIHNRFLLSCV